MNEDIYIKMNKLMKYEVTASNGFDALMLFLVHLTVRDLFLTEDLGQKRVELSLRNREEVLL